LARALPHSGEHGITAVLHGDIVDELHDQNGLANSGSPEKTDLATLGVRLEKVDDFDARLEHLDLRGLVLEFRRLAVNRPAFLGRDRTEAVHRFADDVQDPAKRALS